MKIKELAESMYSSLVAAGGGGVIARVENRVQPGMMVVACHAGCHIRYVGTIEGFTDASLFVNAAVFLNVVDYDAMTKAVEEINGPIREEPIQEADCSEHGEPTTRH